MKRIIYQNQSIDCKENENLLDSFFRNKIEIPFSCRNGTCQACLMHAQSGEIPADSQKGLSTHLKKSNHFLPCKCFPTTDMQVGAPDESDVYTDVHIVKIKQLSNTVFAVSLDSKETFKPYKTGQFINIKTSLDNKIRSYSLTSQYIKDDKLIIHVQKINKGTFSQWITRQAKKGDALSIHYPLGACYNSLNTKVDTKLFIATGSGLGATVAIINEVLDSGYSKTIYLFQSANNENNLYLLKELDKLSNKYKNFKYHLNVTQEKPTSPDVSYEKIEIIAFESFKTLQNAEVYLYGNLKMVEASTKKATELGCEKDNIFYDAFEYAQATKYFKSPKDTDRMEFVEEEKRSFNPDPKMWEALKNGERLNAILNDFYDKVLTDPLMAPFFKGVTKGHIVGKQYAFLNQIFTGKDCYFGDRPRNAHHWMIISDSLFDHREYMFKESCIKCGLKEPFLSQILAFDESYRETMVKTKVWPRITDGEIKPIKGFEEMVLDIGSICDGCSQELEPGISIHYHDRTGEMFCQSCKEG